MPHQFGHEMGGFGGMTGWPFGGWTGTQTPIGTSGQGMGFGGEQMTQTPWQTGGQMPWTGMGFGGEQMTQTPWQQFGGGDVWRQFWQFHQMLEQYPHLHQTMHRMLGTWLMQTPMEHFFPHTGGMPGGMGMFGQFPWQQFTGFGGWGHMPWTGGGFGGGFGQFPWQQFTGFGHFPWQQFGGFGGFGGGFGQFPWQWQPFFGGMFGQFPWQQFGGFGGGSFGMTPWQGMGGFGFGQQPFFGGMGQHMGGGSGGGMGRFWQQFPWQQFTGFGGGFGGGMGQFPWQQFGGGMFRMTDEQITDVVNDWMDCHPMFSGESDIRVECRDGVVTLTGTLHNKFMKHQIGEFCWWLPGVTDVQNQIRVTTRRQEQQGRTGQTAGRTGQTGMAAGAGTRGS